MIRQLVVLGVVEAFALALSDYLGFVHLPAFVILSVFSVAGVELAQRAFPKMPDKIHAYTYVGLLILVVAVMFL